MKTDKTIAAAATGPGDHGLAVIRISGTKSLSILREFVRRSHNYSQWKARYLYHGHFYDAQGEKIDEVLAVYFPSPHSFTGEDCAEIHCHGGRIVQRRILDTLIFAGLTLASPGEFTRRAFLNGRIDLTQAEAVADIINARSEVSRRAALAHLEGSMFRLISCLSSQAADLLALIEAYVDFPEDEIEPLQSIHINNSSRALYQDINRLIESYDQGRIIRNGASLLILGRPNVGKSSLMNLLVGEERSIVSDVPGTTRDTIEESITLSGIPFRIIDSAGIRESLDHVENLGVQRTISKMNQADLVLLVFDASAGFTDADQEILSLCKSRPVMLVANKTDLPCSSPLSPPDLPLLPISCHQRTGLDLLPEMIRDILIDDSSPEGGDEALICDMRHKESLVRSREALVSFNRLVQDGAPIELAAYELRVVLTSLGEITGETTTEDILDRIFSRFCIGK